MAVFAIGDVQGCFDDLQRLLDKIRFDPAADRLWFVGDLVNRGPRSLEVLRFVKSLGEGAVTVLGNHDLHLLAVAAGVRGANRRDTLDPILEAPDREELLTWLRHRPLLHHDGARGFTMIHAGLPPQWDLRLAQACAREVEAVLRSDNVRDFLAEMYGDAPPRWHDDLSGWARLRFIVNCLTRLRYCRPDGELVLGEKGPPGQQRGDHLPWFDVPGRVSTSLRIIFGHWSTLGCYTREGIYALDSGCLWGGALTAMRVATEPRWYAVDCTGVCTPG